DLLSDGGAAPRSRVIFSGRLEIYSLELPSHRPIDFPDQFALNLVAKAERTLITAIMTRIMDSQRFILVMLDLRLVLSTILAVDAEWKIFGPSLFNRFLVPPKGLVFSENVENLESLLHRDSDLFDISAGAIHQRLANIARTYAD